jgi:hypothetical protein
MTADVVLQCRLPRYSTCSALGSGYTALSDKQSMVSLEVTRYGGLCLQLAGLGDATLEAARSLAPYNRQSGSRH